MLDNGFPDDKIISIPFDDPMYNSYTDITQLPAHISDEMKHFFSVYKNLEGKVVETKGWEGKESAKKELLRSLEMYKEKYE